MVAATMQVRARLSVDGNRVVLNTAAHASEHCAIDRESLRDLGSAVGRQVLVKRSSKLFGLYTVAGRAAAPRPAVHVGTGGFARLDKPTGEPSPTEFDVEVATDFIGSGRAAARLTEDVLGVSDTGLAILAPHGGRIEPGTDMQAVKVHELLAEQRRPVRAWIAKGFNPTTGAHTCWHITASEISERSFPGLGSLFDPETARGRFAQAIAFHGQNDTEAVVVGGGLPSSPVHTKLKTRLAAKIHAALQAVTNDPPPVVVQRSGPLAGVQQSNIVNRVTAAGNGMQLEQPVSVRDDKAQRDAIAQAVAGFYAGLLARARA
jgi:phage replication-related protein YjqB (UPF0714/DUF867 family)